ncbi:MAG: FAD:protein FMN transferase [Candidatus Zipacnadales bacterium]
MTISRIIKQSSVLLLFCALAESQSVKDLSLKRVHHRQLHMGVQVRITIYASDEQTGADACRAAFARIAALEDVTSDYRPTSELMRLCARAGQGPIKVSEDLFSVLAFAHYIAERSGGAFDATVGPYTRLWRKSRQIGQLPSRKEWFIAQRVVGWKRMRLDANAHTVELTKPGMILDLGGIAKGYALDQALAVLRDRGLSRALIQAGGDIVVGDPPPGREGWRIKLWGAERGGEWLTVTNCGVSTSGDTEQFVEINGKLYSHIIDPRYGLRCGEPILATITAPDATTSDSLATACVVLGRQAGEALVATFPGVWAYFREAPVSARHARKAGGE